MPGEATGGSRTRKAVDWFARSTALQAAAGRVASEYLRDAERHLQEALSIHPGAVEVAFALIQVGSVTLLSPAQQAHFQCCTSIADHARPQCASGMLPRCHPSHWLSAVWSLPLIVDLICVQLFFATGRPEQALDAAKGIADSSPEDINAHALHLLCLEALGKVDAMPSEALAACVGMLQADGLSHRSVTSEQQKHLPVNALQKATCADGA